MIQNKLSENQKKTLRKASLEAVQDSLFELKSRFHKKKWLTNSNRYRLKTTDRINRDLARSSINHKDLCQYIATSSLLHCTDGWNYLGKSIHSHSQNDYNIAKHLAYYAELKAGMSILASLGIGIFNTRHFIIDRQKNTLLLDKKPRFTTHIITWLALKHWAESTRANKFLLGIIQPKSIALNEWIEAFNYGNSNVWIGSKWMRTWGLDLKNMSLDHDIRNDVTYRPSHINKQQILDGHENRAFIYQFWNICEPVSAPFELLDKHILRESLEAVFISSTGKKPSSSPGIFKKRIVTMLDHLSFPNHVKKSWENFFLRRTEPDTPHIIQYSNKCTSDNENPQQHFEVMARATLLLRIATALNAELIKNAHINLSETDFWWDTLGESRGFWKPGNKPANCIDLWTDVEIAMANMQQWEVTNRPNTFSHTMVQDCSNELITLSSCERIALWGIGL